MVEQVVPESGCASPDEIGQQREDQDSNRRCAICADGVAEGLTQLHVGYNKQRQTDDPELQHDIEVDAMDCHHVFAGGPVEVVTYRPWPDTKHERICVPRQGRYPEIPQPVSEVVGHRVGHSSARDVEKEVPHR
jgi:hypothetical protein